MLGQDSIEQILGYYPEMTMQGADGKEEKEYVNRYFIMHKVATDKKSMDREKYAAIEEIKFNKILKEVRKGFWLHTRAACSGHSKLHVSNDFLMKVKHVQLTGNKSAVQNCKNRRFGDN